MCNFFSCIVAKSGEVFFDELSDRHSTIIDKYNLSDTTNFARVEILPTACDVFTDPSTWNVRVDEPVRPKWLTSAHEESARKVCELFVKKSVFVGKNIEKLDHGRVWMKDCTLTQMEGGTLESMFGGTLKIMSGGTLAQMSGGTLESMFGGTLKIMSGGTLKSMFGGTLKIMSGGTLKSMSGGMLKCMSGGMLESMFGGTLEYLCGGTLKYMEGGTLKTMSGGTLESMYGDAIAVIYTGEYPVIRVANNKIKLEIFENKK